MGPRLRKLALTTHVLSSVGWFGAVAAFFVLAAVGLNAAGDVARGVYESMRLITWSSIVPLCFASLLTGIVQGLGTPWGLTQHYWVLIKLLLTAGSTAILLLHTGPIGTMADAASASSLAGDALRSLRVQLVVDAGAALVVLVLTTALSVIKPKGTTPFARPA
jgi:hypothetical protein